MKVKSESEVSQSYPTLSDPMDCSLPGSSTRGTFQARVLEWGAIAFSCIKPLRCFTHYKPVVLSSGEWISVWARLAKTAEGSPRVPAGVGGWLLLEAVPDFVVGSLCRPLLSGPGWGECFSGGLGVWRLIDVSE